MEVIKVIPQGYCKGVINAIKIVQKARKDYPNEKIYILGMLVHNNYVSQALQLNNIITLTSATKSQKELIDEIDEGIIVFTAHGIAPSIKNYALEKGLTVIDASCDDVIKNTKLCLNYLKQDYDIIYIGIAKHPESEAIISLSDKIHLVTDESSINQLEITNKLIYVTNQTTMSILQLKTLFALIKAKYPTCIINEEVCMATYRRQMAIASQKDVDAIIIVGDPKSNNTNQLANIAAKNNADVIMIQSAQDLLKYKLDNYQVVAVSSGASTPYYLSRQVINYLETLDKSYLEVDLSKVLEL